nr:hypothetical protein [Tanacetum cinerariifolium]
CFPLAALVSGSFRSSGPCWTNVSFVPLRRTDHFSDPAATSPLMKARTLSNISSIDPFICHRKFIKNHVRTLLHKPQCQHPIKTQKMHDFNDWLFGGNISSPRSNRSSCNFRKGRKKQDGANGVCNNKMSFAVQHHNRNDQNEKLQSSRKEIEGPVVKKFFGQGKQVEETPDANKGGIFDLSVGIILISLKEKMYSYAIRLKLKASNYAMDYEALLAGLTASANQGRRKAVGKYRFDDTKEQKNETKGTKFDIMEFYKDGGFGQRYKDKD